MIRLKLSGQQHELLAGHLFPGDEKEAVALALCGRTQYQEEVILLVHEVHLIPHDACLERKEDRVSWPTELVNPLLDKAQKYGWAIVKIHCHPGGGEFFSDYDDHSDQELFSCIHAWLDDGRIHGSCIMLPDFRIFGRVFGTDLIPRQIDQVFVAGSTIHHWYYDEKTSFQTDLSARNIQAFGKKTVAMLSKLRIGIVGCSGTGSIVIEQLKRLGVGHLVLVDPETIDRVNLNRIIGSTLKDADNNVSKVEVMKREIDKSGFNTVVEIFQKNIVSKDAVQALAVCDLVFGCVDSHEGRYILDLLSVFYHLPYFDVGVKLAADGKGGIEDIFGSVHYMYPGGSSLLSRNAYTLEKVRSEGRRRQNNEEAQKDQYLAAVDESSPAVISVNMLVASLGVNDFLARIHPYRRLSNDEVDSIRFSLADGVSFTETATGKNEFKKFIGRGDMAPLLNNPEFD